MRLDVSQNDYGGYLACAPISIAYAYMSLKMGDEEDVLHKVMEVGSYVWQEWLKSGVEYNIMSLLDILKYYPNIFDNCDHEEYGGIDIEQLRIMFNDGYDKQSVGAITIVSTDDADNIYNSIGFSYGLRFHQQNVIIFDSHPPYARLIECQNFTDILQYLYKGNKKYTLYSGLLFNRQV